MRSPRPSRRPEACSTSPPATATRRSPRPAAGATSCPPITCRSLLERGKARAAADGLSVRFKEADAEALALRRRELRRRGLDLRRDVHAEPGSRGEPNSSGSARAAARSGSPTGRRRASSARSSRRSASYLPPPAGAKSPALWGTEGAASTRCSGHRRATIKAERRSISCSATARRSTSSTSSELLRPGAEGVRGARHGQAGRPAARSSGADRNDEPLRRRHDGRCPANILK